MNNQPREFTVTIPGLPPASQPPNSRVHFMVKARERKEFMHMVALAILGAGLKDLRLPRAKIELEFIVAENRRRDYDNWTVRGSKPIADTLVNMGILPDDDTKHLEVCIPVFTVDKKKAPMTVVTIWEAREMVENWKPKNPWADCEMADAWHEGCEAGVKAALAEIEARFELLDIYVSEEDWADIRRGLRRE